MFCPECGSKDQQAGTYCRQCGTALPDPSASGVGPFRKLTREGRIFKMRVLGAISAALSLISAALIYTVMSGIGGRILLFLAASFCVLVAIYQAFIFYFGYRVLNPPKASAAAAPPPVDRPSEMPAAENPSVLLEVPAGASFGPPDSVTEDTTRRLEPTERRKG